MTCQDCENARVLPLYGIYNSNCPSCQARMACQSPDYDESEMRQKLTSGYKRILASIGTVEEAHQMARAWRKLLDSL